jgi:hypothetical protein
MGAERSPQFSLLFCKRFLAMADRPLVISHLRTKLVHY